jgi:hypothetical protein
LEAAALSRAPSASPSAIASRGSAPSEQRLGVLDALAGPSHRGQDFRDADLAVAVGVHQGERAGVELEARRRAAQDRPQLRVELAEVAQVLAGLDGDLVEAPDAEELPAVRAAVVGHGAVSGILLVDSPMMPSGTSAG